MKRSIHSDNILQSILFTEFCTIYDKYPIHNTSIYHIIRDLFIKNEVENINIFDGKVYEFSNYMIECQILKDGSKRIFLPHSIEIDLDLLWLYSFIKICKIQNIEVYVCFYTPECIIYELAEIGIS